MARLAAKLPLPQLHLPYLFTADLAPEHLDLLAHDLLDGITKLEGPPT